MDIHGPSCICITHHLRQRLSYLTGTTLQNFKVDLDQAVIIQRIVESRKQAALEGDDLRLMNQVRVSKSFKLSKEDPSKQNRVRSSCKHLTAFESAG